MSSWTFLAVLIAMVALTTCQEYELDQNKLNQRYDLIQSLVAAGVPKAGGHSAVHKPRIGGAYAYPNVGYSRSYPTASRHAPSSYGGYNTNNLYGVGASPNYGNYGASSYGYGAGLGALSFKPGGGVYHPLFNNANLYKPKQTYEPTYNNYNDKDPIYLGNSKSPGLYSQSGKPQIDAYGRPAAAGPYTGKNVGGSAYAGQQGGVYSNIPGYTNPYYNKY